MNTFVIRPFKIDRDAGGAETDLANVNTVVADLNRAVEKAKTLCEDFGADGVGIVRDYKVVWRWIRGEEV